MKLNNIKTVLLLVGLLMAFGNMKDRTIRSNRNGLCREV